MELSRAYSVLTVKSVDEEQRLIEGIATTPSTDRVGDIVESEGAQFTTPIPLLWQHDPRNPIGHVLEAHPSKSGIRVIARIPKHVTPEIDRAWQLIKHRLVAGLSIGFRSLEHEPIDKKDPWGPQRVKKWEWLELSAVTIPANTDASIHLIRSLDTAAALSGSAAVSARSLPPAVVGRHIKDSSMTTNAPPIADQITAASAELKTKSSRLEELILKDGADGDLEETERTELATVRGEVNRLSDRVNNLKALEKAQMSMARPVSLVRDQNDIRDVGRPQATHVEVKSNLAPGQEMGRVLICKMAALRYGGYPGDYAKQHFPDSPRVVQFFKDMVPAATTGDTTFMSPLVNATTLVSEFVEFLRPQTIVGRIRNLRRVPFNVRIAGQTTGGTGYWVGEGQAKPLTRFATNATTLAWAKVATIIALTEELARFSSPSAELLCRDELVACLQERLDIDFVDPSKAAVANTSPASITNGITNLDDSGATLANCMTDIAQFFNAISNANIPWDQCTWIMPSTVAVQLSLMLNASGQRAFADMTPTGGTWVGLPVITSQHLLFSHTPANNKVILVHGPSIAIADDGGFTVDVSREAALEMDDAPVMAAGSAAGGSPSGPTGSAMVSLWQTNSIGIRAERFINWARLRNTGVVWMDDVRWAA